VATIVSVELKKITRKLIICFMFEFKLFSGSSLIPEILPSLRLSRKRKGIPQKKKENLLEGLAE